MDLNLKLNRTQLMYNSIFKYYSGDKNETGFFEKNNSLVFRLLRVRILI